VRRGPDPFNFRKGNSREESSIRHSPPRAALIALALAVPLAAMAQTYGAGAATTAAAAQEPAKRPSAPALPGSDQALSRPIVARDEAPPPDTGPNPGDRVRSEMQSHVRPWPWNDWRS
jgi:hypothetical protein